MQNTKYTRPRNPQTLDLLSLSGPPSTHGLTLRTQIRISQTDGFPVISLWCPHNQQFSTHIQQFSTQNWRTSDTFVRRDHLYLCTLLVHWSHPSAHWGTLLWCNGYSRRLSHFFQEMLLLWSSEDQRVSSGFCRGDAHLRINVFIGTVG